VVADLSSINYRETAITLTPSDSGRFEVYLDGKKLYDRKAPGAVDFLPALKEIHTRQRELEPPCPSVVGLGSRSTAPLTPR